MGDGLGRCRVGLAGAVEQEADAFVHRELGDADRGGGAIPLFAARGEEGVAMAVQVGQPRAHGGFVGGVIEDEEPGRFVADGLQDAQGLGLLVGVFGEA